MSEKQTARERAERVAYEISGVLSGYWVPIIERAILDAEEAARREGPPAPTGDGITAEDRATNRERGVMARLLGGFVEAWDAGERESLWRGIEEARTLLAEQQDRTGGFTPRTVVSQVSSATFETPPPAPTGDGITTEDREWATETAKSEQARAHLDAQPAPVKEKA